MNLFTDLAKLKLLHKVLKHRHCGGYANEAFESLGHISKKIRKRGDVHQMSIAIMDMAGSVKN